MIKKSFFGFKKPKLEYTVLDNTVDEVICIKPSEKIIFHLRKNGNEKEKVLLDIGDPVKIGQKLIPFDTSVDFCISSCPGTISDLSDFTGIFGEKFISITIDINDKEQSFDESFKNGCHQPTIKSGVDFFSGLPGKPDFSIFTDPDKPIKTIVVFGMDDELLCTTNQHFVKSHIDDIKEGINLLSKISGVTDIVLVVPPQLAKIAESTQASIKIVNTEYPNANRELMEHAVSSSGEKQSAANSNIAFFSAEAICSLAAVHSPKQSLLHKTLTFFSKTGRSDLVAVPIGTSVKDILNNFDETLADGDRIIIGGPMKGVAVFSTDFPVSQDTDMIMIQDGQNIITNDDAACINCGACVRVCPANIQVNHLIRLLEAGEYTEAAENYDLFSCVDCGFCSYVCEARIGIFQQIKLAKRTLEGTEAYEKINA